MAERQNLAIDAARRQTRAVYERKAAFWHQVRAGQLYERPWLDRFTAALPVGGRILDLACGTGKPLADYFLTAGFDLTGVDYAASMIDIASAEYPQGHWHVADIRNLPVLGRFDGICSWDGFFHLSVAEQRDLLPMLASATRPGGAILLTVGFGEGEVTGHVDGETVYHASLEPTEYEQILRDAGFAQFIFQREDPACMGRSLVLARQKQAP